jgi:hypothetical protein
METYIGTKIIQAKPEIREEKSGYKIIYPDGYVSWSPKNVFEAAYRRISLEEKCLMFSKPIQEPIDPPRTGNENKEVA